MTVPATMRRTRPGSLLFFITLLVAMLYLATISSFPEPGIVQDGSKVSMTRKASGFTDAPASCRVSDLLDDPLTLEYGQNNIRLSRTYEGSGFRVRKMLQKAMRGENITIAVVGGSVSAGHGIRLPRSPETYMYSRIHQWFKDTFPSIHIELNLDSTIPATYAEYFSYCLAETIPDNPDLVLLELDINHGSPTKESIEATESLFRSILAMPGEPALVYLSVFALMFSDMTHGWRHSALISQWLDVPEINIRNFMLPHLIKHPEAVPAIFKNRIGALDTRHINSEGHCAMADMVIAFLREQLCILERDDPANQQAKFTWPANDIAGGIPRLGMLQQYDETSTWPVLRPRCQSITSTKFPLKPLRAEGWAAVDRNDKRSYEATVPGAEISFAVHVEAGMLGIIPWKTKDESFGQVVCWVDNDTAANRIRRVVAYERNRLASIFSMSVMWKDLAPGPHVLTCKLERGPTGGKIFRIAATVSR